MLGAPFEVGETLGVDEVDLGLERTLKTVMPVLHGGDDRQVGGFQRVHAGLEYVGHPAFVDEHRHLTFADRQLRTIFDLVAVTLEAPEHGVRTVVGPLDDIDEFADDFIPDHFQAPFSRG